MTMATQVQLGSIAQVPKGEGRTFRVGPTQIAVFHTRTGQVYATQSHCPHRRGPLADGLLGSGRLTCPLHDWTFDLATGSPLSGECGIKLYPVTCSADGMLLLDWD
jgi:nitrite reductase (NADH) small subunit